MLLQQVTQSWGMAPVTSPGCWKMLPGERGGDTASPGHGEGDTAPTCPSEGLGPSCLLEAACGVSGREGSHPGVPPQHEQQPVRPSLGGFPVTLRVVTFKAVARDNPA